MLVIITDLIISLVFATFWVISLRNLTSFTRPFLAGRSTWEGHKAKIGFAHFASEIDETRESGLVSPSTSRWQHIAPVVACCRKVLAMCRPFLFFVHKPLL